MRRELYFAEDTIKQTTNVNSTFNAGGAARVQGSTLTAADDLTLQATGDVVVESAADEANIKVKGYKKLTTTQKSSELTAGGDVAV